MFSLIFCIVLGVLSILLFMGKCSWLIAGYNTASKEEKAMYDEKKLCRTVGVILLCTSITTGLMSFIHGGIFVLTCILVEVIVIIAGIIYANTACKRR